MIPNSFSLLFTDMKLSTSTSAEILKTFPFSGLNPDFALSPVIKFSESNIIDLPAPVSPVKTHKPLSNDKSILSINNKFLIDNNFIILH